MITWSEAKRAQDKGYFIREAIKMYEGQLSSERGTKGRVNTADMKEQHLTKCSNCMLEDCG